ncbi:MAG: hypothetical protein DBX47_03795 [Clostridiales bacterium]|nr:MAG: hypothetical protein DBX47_03795 [Clostridiales bacterium]
MQVKKDAVQKAIIKAATDEFLKYGYAGASMRRMAKAAGTGLGNFYNYFSSKDEIFAYIVSDQYAKTQAYIARSLSENMIVDFKNIRDTRLFCQEFKRWLVRSDPLFNKNMFLLLDCSTGTHFQSAKDELVVGLTQVFTTLFDFPKGSLAVPPFLFFEQTINNLLQIVRKYQKDPQLKQIAFNSFYSSCLGYILCAINI